MGLKGFYPWLRKKRDYHPTLRHPMHHHLPDGATIHVDVLCFFNNIRGIYARHADNKTRAHAIFFEHLNKYGNPSRMVFYVDSAPALEKKETHHERNEKQVKAFKTAKVAVETLSNRVSQGRPPTKQMFKNVEKSLHGGFKWSLRDREDFVDFLQDSDFFAYDSVTTFWRPVGKRYEVKVLEYNREAVLAQIKLSTTKLTALAYVSSNDQNKNIPSMGIATNYRIYPMQSATPLTTSPASSLSYDLLCQQYKLVKGQYARVNANSKRAAAAATTDATTSAARGLCMHPAVESRIRIRVMPQPNQGSQATSSSPAGTPTEDEGEENAEDDSDEDAEPFAMDKPFTAFYRILLAHIYCRKIKSKTVTERGLLESTATQLYRSIKMMYRNGSVAFEKKINSQADGQPGTVLSKIDPKLPAIENYLLLNKTNGGSRRIAHLSPLAARDVGFSERHLLPLFWHWPTVKDKIQLPAQADALNWLAQTTPGCLITTFLTDVGLPPDKHDKGHRKVTTVMDMDSKNGKEGLREHLGCLRAETFDPKEWHGKGYVLKGSIRTNGRLLQLLAFKLKELQSVRYRRVPEDKLPNPLVTIIGGTNSCLTEARNVFSTTVDVESLLAADPSQVAVLSLDLGTTWIVGATVSLQPGQTPVTLKRPLGKEGDQKKKKKKTRRAKRKPGDRKRQRERQKERKLTKQPQTIRYFDQVVKRKAVSRPTGSFANWLEDRKVNTTGAPTGRTIQDLESALPPLKGEGASFCEYVAARQGFEGDMNDFYNNTNYWKHQWDANVCRKEEFYKVAEGLLNMIGGSVERPRLPHQLVVIAIGLAKFTAVNGPPSLDGTFQAFFVNLVGHIFATTIL
ncbi:hypothetical protein BGX30_013492 [Mortierella sp. GBA39]|nr:hypothetical protein BGX30_013492 [Mortierella sp. GBA39]